MVALELERVLRGYYGLPVEQAVAGVRNGLDFADALHHASCRSCEAMASFDDRGFVRRIWQLNLAPRLFVPTRS